MMISETPVLAGQLVLIGLALAGSVWDFRLRLIPNWLCVLIFAAGLVSTYATGGVSMLSSAAMHGLVALLGGMGLFALKAIGGGDAKFYASLAAWFPLAHAFLYLLAVSLAGLALLVIWQLGGSQLRHRKAKLPLDSPFRKLPYGVAIGAGAIATVLSI